MLLDVAKVFLKEADWSYEADDDTSSIRAFYDGGTVSFPVYISANDELEQLVLYGVLPYSVDEEHRIPVGAFLSALNYGLKVGNFEIDLGDGEVRFRTGIDVQGGTLNAAMVRSLAASCVINVDLYATPISYVALGKMTPQEAIDEVGE